MTGKKHYHPAPPGWRPKPLKIGQRVLCGAWARSRGRRCRQAPMKGFERCRMHGPNNGAQTPEAKARISAAVKAGWHRWRVEQMGLPPDWRSTANRVCRQKRERLGLTAAAYIERHGRHQPEGEAP